MGVSGPSLPIESTDPMIIKYHNCLSFQINYLWINYGLNIAYNSPSDLQKSCMDNNNTNIMIPILSHGFSGPLSLSAS